MANRMKERYVSEIAPALLDFGAALAADAGLLAVLDLEADADALAALIAEQGNLAGTDRSLALNNATGLALTTGLGVAGSHIDLLNDDLVLSGHGNQDLALYALVLTGQNDNGIILLNVHPW